MSRRIDVFVIRRNTEDDIKEALDRFKRYENKRPALDDLRWYSCMTLISLHASWERFAERRLVASLNSNPGYFLTENGVRGIKHIPAGLAQIIVTGGNKYFDFRSYSDLVQRADKLLSRANNPFITVSKVCQDHLDVMSTIRNLIVHESDASWDSYKRKLKAVFGITSAPTAGEFLDSIDRRTNSPAPREKRLIVLADVLSSVVARV
jgi:hypothetical protein